MLEKVWNFLTRSFWCHDCRRLARELDKMTHDYIAALRRIGNTRQLYEKDGDAIASRLHLVERRLLVIHKLMVTPDKKKRRRK